MKVKKKSWKSFVGRGLVILLLSGLMLVGIETLAAASPPQQDSAEGESLFMTQCASCHSIGGGTIVGPDLAGVLDRRDRDWVVEFIASPDLMLANGDPIATELLVEFNNVPMPNLGLSVDQVESLIVFFESGATINQAAGPLPNGNARRGANLFTGRQAFENGGTPCNACHTVGSIGDFGGGNFGPDLTKVFSRYGKTGLVSAIQNIAFPTMSNVYAQKALAPQEVADLVAFFVTANAGGGEGAASSFTPIFWGVGIIGAGLLFGVMAIFWPRQRESLTERLRRYAGITSRRDS